MCSVGHTPMPDATDENDEPRADVTVVGVDEQGIIVHVTGDPVALLGWAPQDLVGTPLAKLVPARFRGPHADGFDRFARSGELGLVGRTLALPALTAGGDERDIELVLSLPSRSDTAAVVGVMRAPEGATRSRLAGIQTAIQNVLVAEAATTSALEDALSLVGQSGPWAAGTVWALDQWTGRLRSLAVWAEDDGTHRRYIDARSDAALERGDPSPIAATWRDGTVRWVDAGSDEADHDPALGPGGGSVLLHPLLQSDGTVGVLELVLLDGAGLSIHDEEQLWQVADNLAGFVARRSRAEADDAQRQRVQLALTARGMGVWVHRVGSGEVIWDETMERLHGFPPGSFDGRLEDYAGRIHPDDRDAVVDAIRRAVETGERFDYRCRVQRLDGAEVWLEGSGIPISDGEGRLAEIMGVCYDVTADVEATRDLQERVRQSALAADVGRAFVGDTNLPEKLQRCAEAIVEHLGAAFARVWVLPPDGDVLELYASAGLYTHLDGGHARVRVGDLKIGRIAATREPHLTNSVRDDPRISDPEWARREGMESFAGYPLIVGDRLVGVLALFARHPLHDSTLDALGAIADTVSIGIEQARSADEVLALYERTRRHAEEMEVAARERARVLNILQQSLLPPSLPRIPGLELAARFRAGTQEVGGDFYDLFPLADHRWAFVVGDICGRGPEAARFTALARHSLRTALMLGHEPASAMATLNAALLESHNEGRFCTAVCGVMRLEPEVTAVELAVAGHPPPMVLRTDGSVEELHATGPLSGVFPAAQYTQLPVGLASGDTIVLYTDGVTEARQGSDLFGIGGLRRLLESLNGHAPRDIIEAIIEAVTGFEATEADDDLAVVVIRRT